MYVSVWLTAYRNVIAYGELTAYGVVHVLQYRQVLSVCFWAFFSFNRSFLGCLQQIFDPGFDTELTKKAPFCLWQSIEKLFQQLTNPATAEDPNRSDYKPVVADK